MWAIPSTESGVHTVLSAFAPKYRKREVAKKATARIDPADYPSLIFML
jgi:hypothetical protein